MTTGTIAPEVAVVNIVRCVAGHALAGQLQFVSRLHMALAASQFGMRALARETRGGVIKLPVRPTIRIVTSSAPITERTLVVVIGLVTSDALRRGTAVAAVRVALLAAHGSVQSH